MLRAATQLIAATIGVAALTAGAAQAAPTLSPAGPYTTSSASIVVSGSVPSSITNTATHFAIAECNIGAVNPADWAKRCNGNAGSFTNLAALSNMTYSGNITVDDSFADVSFSPGPQPTTTTDCQDTVGSDPCGVLVSFYEIVGGVPQFVGLDFRAITFQ